MVGITARPDRGGGARMARTVGAVVAPPLLAVGFLTGCTTHTPPRTLEDTSWRLVSIESMNDADGLTSVPRSTPFTVSFGADGNASFQFDCNRGSGTFEAEPTGDGTTGSLKFNPIAVTEMGCPTESLATEIGAALPNVRGYVFKGEQLHMSLMFDGGILNWDPA
ncbi:MAG: META domain-containing protein [Mycobacterium sp.]